SAGRHARELRPPALRELPRASSALARASGAAEVTGRDMRPRAERPVLSLIGRLAAVMLASGCGASAPPPAGVPARIVSLAPSVTEIVYALGAGDRLVGVCGQCDRPAAVAKLPR